MPSRARFVSTLAVLVLAVAGCSDDGPGQAAAPPPEPATPFDAAAPPPAGWQVSQCSDLRSRSSSGLATRFAVPPSFAWLYRDGPTCELGEGFSRELFVTLEPATTLAETKEQDVDPYTAPGQGDGQLGEVSYAADVPVFGTRTGERLDYYCFCDGQELDYRMLQASGVRVTWISPHGRSRHADELTAVTDTMALLRSSRSTCSARGLHRAASYAPPIPQTESIDSSGDGCHLYLQPGRSSLHRYAEVVPEPRHTVDRLAAALRHDRRASDVRVTRDAAELDGRRADRLSWHYRDSGRTWRGVTLASPALQVTWSATQRQWRQEADVVRRFVGSVHLLR